MKGNLAVDAFIALRCTVFVPWGLDKSRCNSIDSDSFWLKLLHQRFGQEMNGCLGNSVHNRRRIRLASCIGTHKKYTSAFSHHRHQLLYHKHRNRQVCIHNVVPFLESIILKFIIGADSRIADQPVYMSGFFLHLCHKCHHLLIGGHICF